MEPSSLVFVAIIGVWAAYLVPNWARRRVAMAQSRARDRFSPSARVLDRREPSRAGGDQRSAHRSGDAVLRPPAFVRDHGPLVRDHAIPADHAIPVQRSDVGEAARARARAEERAAVAAHALAVEQAGAAAVRRARTLLTLVALVAGAWGAGVLLALPLWVPALITGLLPLDLLAGRVAAVQSRRAVMSAHARLETAHRRTRTLMAPAAVVQPSVRPDNAMAAAGRAVAVGDDTWVPVPVPPPTYTLKPMAPRPEPAPLDLPAAYGDEYVPAGAEHRHAAVTPAAARGHERYDEADDFEQRKVVNG